MTSVVNASISAAIEKRPLCLDIPGTSNRPSAGSSVRHRRTIHETIHFRCSWALAATDLSGAPSILLGPPLAIAADKADLIDINTATAEQLKALPGIDDAYAEKITKDRSYQREDKLVQK